MYNQQNFGSFRGGSQGAGFGQSSFGGQYASSQYRGLQQTYQPSGPVASVYGQSQSMPSQSFGYSSFQSQSPQSFHSANYRGNQTGHDNYLRGDSSRPTNAGGFASSTYSGGLQNQSFSPSQFGGGMQSFGQGYSQSYNPSQSYSQSQYQNPNTFHTSGYRGDQAGHDAYLHADSTQPSNTGGFASGSYGAGSSMMGAGASSFGRATPTLMNMNAAGFQSQNQSQYQNANSFHTANYRGNQQNHDEYLRADATQPSNIGQFGGSSYGGGSFARF